MAYGSYYLTKAFINSTNIYWVLSLATHWKTKYINNNVIVTKITKVVRSCVPFENKKLYWILQVHPMSSGFHVIFTKRHGYTGYSFSNQNQSCSMAAISKWAPLRKKQPLPRSVHVCGVPDTITLRELSHFFN